MTEDRFLLLHGYGETAAIWDNIGFLLHPVHQKRINLSDLFASSHLSPCFESIAAAIGAQIEREEIGRTTIIANSMGGYLALELLKQRPTHFKKLILIASHPFVDNNEKIMRRNREIELISKGKANQLFKAFAHNLPEPQKGSLLNMWNQWGNHALINALTAMKTREPRLSTVKNSHIPIHFIVGMKDQNIDCEELHSSLENIQNANVHMIPFAGHWLLHEVNALFEQIITACLKS